MQTAEFLVAARLEVQTLEMWIEGGWLVPRADEAQRFSEVDLARVQLIRDLAQLGVNDDAIPVVLDLVDQLHGLRSSLRNLLSAIQTQPESARLEIIRALRASRAQDGSFGPNTDKGVT
ncbi:MAG: hypothetical protein ACJ8F3_00075 [Xanthobacteraceae bacterium]